MMTNYIIMNTTVTVGGGHANGTVPNVIVCAQDIPVASQIINDNLPNWARGLVALFTICSVVSVAIFIEEIVFLSRRFNRGSRLNRTLWILATFPIYTVTSFLAVLVPRSGTLINLVANTFFASVIHQVVQLMVCYLGGKERMWKVLGESREISLQTMPCCCCCRCLPAIQLNKRSYNHLYNMIIQFTIIRPVLMFVAAVLWTNKSYIPGDLLPNNTFLYISSANLASTLVAMWSMMILRGAFRPQLDEQYKLSGKVQCVQLTMLVTSVVNIICGVLVTTNVIKCTQFLNSRARGDQFYHEVLTVLSCILGIVARFFYRRESDAQRIFNYEEMTGNDVTMSHSNDVIVNHGNDVTTAVSRDNTLVQTERRMQSSVNNEPSAMDTREIDITDQNEDVSMSHLKNNSEA